MSTPKPRVLIVDEPSVERTALCHLLEGDFQVATATAAEARSVAEAEDSELVLVGLATGDALAVCNSLKSDPATAELPVLLLSVPEDEALEASALKAGAADFLPHPLRAATVMARIKVHIENRRFRGILKNLSWLDA
ncbi:MAG: hypothetical protein Q8O00_02675, partial [Holophaga sp.]|nr:hypothetical protein [Holophaga sp.]